MVFYGFIMARIPFSRYTDTCDPPPLKKEAIVAQKLKKVTNASTNEACVKMWDFRMPEY